WAKTFEEHQILQVLPRMSGATPDYVTYYSLIRSPDWQLTHQEAASASFYRTTSGNAALTAYLQEHDATSFVSRMLRADDEAQEEPISRGIWPRPPSFYDRYVYLPQHVVPSGINMAAHYNFLREYSLQNQRLGDAMALAYATIRSAREGLRVRPHTAAGYRLLGVAYEFLGAVENSIQQGRGLEHPLTGRFYEMMASYHQVLDCEPEDVNAMYRLFEVYNAHNRYDLASKYLQFVEDVTGSTSILPITNPDQFEQEQANNERKTELQAEIQRVREQVDSALQSQNDRLSAAQSAYAAGCPQLALDVLEADLTLAASNPLARLLMGILLLEVGRTAEARDQLESLRGTPVADQAPEWPIMAAYASLAADELPLATSTLKERHDELENVMVSALLGAMPLQFVGPAATPEGPLDWGDGEVLAPARQAQTVALLSSALQPRLQQIDLFRALIAVETGEATEAARLFDEIIARNPQDASRPLVEQYLLLIADRQLKPPASPEPSLEPDLFNEGDPKESSSSSEPPAQDGKGNPAVSNEPRPPVDGDPVEKPSGSEESGLSGSGESASGESASGEPSHKLTSKPPPDSVKPAPVKPSSDP
ncbi:MAG: tetratricopeptide repeat protein, partial [Planctomycetaceae bacterium]